MLAILGRGLTLVGIHQYPRSCSKTSMILVAAAAGSFNNNIHNHNYYYNFKKIIIKTTTTTKKNKTVGDSVVKRGCCCSSTSSSRAVTGFVAAAAAVILMFSSAATAAPNAIIDEPYAGEGTSTTLENIPQMLSGDDECVSSGASATTDCKKGIRRIQRPKSRKAESCTLKCVTTCIRGGAGSPGEGPLNAIRPLVVFKQGFRSRQYCLVECSDICNLIKESEEGP